MEYEYTMPDTPESNRLVINMENSDVSGGACSVSESTTPSACDPLPSFEMFNQAPSIANTSCWYSIPSASENMVQSVPETIQTESANHFIETSGSGPEKRDSSDRSFLMENILDLEQHCYTPRHSTPTKDNHNTVAPRTTESEGYLYAQPWNMELSTATKTSNNVNRRQSDKPPYSYVAMIIVAILNSEKKELTLSGIREKLRLMFPYFTGEYTGWKNSIRHALSNSKCFYKVERRSELDTVTVYVWKVNAKYVKPNYTFNRHSKGLNFDKYKLTLQEELGLPPFDFTDEIDCMSKEDITLPPKPCFQTDSVSLAGSASDDFLGARNDSVPTPQSTASDIDSVYSVSSSATDSVLSRKRKRTEDLYSTQQTSYDNKRKYVAMSYQYPQYGYQQYSDSVLPYDPYYYSTDFTYGQHDTYQFNYPLQTLSGAQPYSNSDHNSHNAWKQWWFQQAYYQTMASGSYHATPYSVDNSCFPSTAMDLTKHSKNSD